MSCEAFRQFVVLLFVVGSFAAARQCLKLGASKPSVCARLYQLLLMYGGLLQCIIDSLVTV
jgi:hypothetical protein